MKRLNRVILALGFLALLSGLLPVFAGPAPEEAGECIEKIDRIADPIESYNRAIYIFNDKFYFYLLKPVARGYKASLPEKVRLSVRNMLSNAAMPVRFVNCLLQGKLRYASTELAGFTVNTTWGVAGLFNPARSCLHLKRHKEDFGQTLGFYGIKEGFFITWPFLGPSNLRDTLGLAVDYFSDPLVYVEPLVKTGTTVLDRINETSLTLGEYEDFKKSALDPYVSLRNAHFQYRRNQIKE